MRSETAASSVKESRGKVAATNTEACSAQDNLIDNPMGRWIQNLDSLPFEEWLRQERERLHRLVLDALFELAARKLAQADFSAARNLALRQLALEPWREVAYRQLMEALALHGERSAALAQYEACRVALKQELNIKPSAETEALAARIRNLQLERGARAEPTAPFERRQLTTEG